MAGLRYYRPKGKDKNGNRLPGLYTSISQAKDLHQEERDRMRAKNQTATNGPAASTTPPVPATSPILGGGPVASTPLPGSPLGKQMPGDPSRQLPGGGPVAPPMPDTSVPSWWINSAITNPTSDEQKFANTANALLPTLAPEDQRTLASYLAQNYKDVYGGYANATFDQAPTEINDAVRNKFLSPQRAQLAVSLLDKMKQASGVQDMGAGYDYLKNAVNLINQFTNDGVMTRERYQQFVNAVGNLNKNAGSNLSAYANLSQLFNLPQFTAGPLMSNTPNSKLFG